MTKPFKVIVWGPGHMGAVAILEALQSPSMELVGVRAYSESKLGKDVGELLGVPPTGIIATDDVRALLKLDCDCVIYVAHDEGTYHTDDEIIQILEAGKNIVTTLPYTSMDKFREAGTAARFEAACLKGGATFYADGIDPNLVPGRLLLALTNACADVTTIKLEENWDCSEAEPHKLQYIGFGATPEEANKIEVSKTLALNFLNGVVYRVGEMIGVTYDRVVASHDFVPAAEDIHKPFLVKAGTVGRITHRVEGFVDNLSAAPLFVIEAHWFIGDTMLAEGVKPGQHYVGTIEGRPSVKMTLDFSVSNKTDEKFFMTGDIKSEPIYIASVMPIVQAIPSVCDAEPGLMPSIGPALHWKPGLLGPSKR